PTASQYLVHPEATPTASFHRHNAMLTPLLVAVLLPLASVASAGYINSYDAQAQAIIDGFSTAQVLGQMTQLDLSTVMINSSTRTINETALRAYAKLNVGSYFNTNWGDKPIMGRYSYNASEFRAIVQRIQEVSMEENGGHPVIYGLDSIHGASYVSNAVLLPHQINQGASFNPDLVYEVGRITSRDSEAAGACWIFSPILDISQNSLWARTLETYGEDPYLTSIMGASYVRGLQSYNQTAACVKHFLGYSKTPTGHDRDAVNMPDFDLLNYFMPPYKLLSKLVHSPSWRTTSLSTVTRWLQAPRFLKISFEPIWVLMGCSSLTGWRSTTCTSSTASQAPARKLSLRLCNTHPLTLAWYQATLTLSSMLSTCSRSTRSRRLAYANQLNV
ncbi:hypothetical protein L917_16080, partial [Phytophthora nicotianae]